MLKSIMFAVATLVLSSFAVIQTAQASPIITQEFLFDDGSSFGFLSIDTADIDADGNVSQWHAFELFGYEIGEVFDFSASFDIDNLFAGLTFLNFDANDVSDFFAFQGSWFADFDLGFFTIYTADGDYLIDDYMVMGAPVVSGVTVPEPGTLFLMLSVMGGLLLRRRA
ncbi:PEP-CTERM sorting domain-containing protein [Rheinheimera metallidurans]|uniref:PEP-CTERM sorting domain-containing protein n=1 Tax=Rheinheimera metallidurans TaxID=2925781 RepID=UPI0030026E6F